MLIRALFSRKSTLLNVLQRRTGSAIRSSVLVYVAGASVPLIYVAGLAILDAEQHAAGTQVRDIGEGVWWAFVTIPTVGYGDIFPVTVAELSEQISALRQQLSGTSH